MHATSEEDTYNHKQQINMVFANCSEEDVTYTLTVKEIAQAQKVDAVLKKLSKHDKYSNQLVEDTQLLCKDGKTVIPTVLQNKALSWYHHYFRHPGHTHLEETLHAVMYWKGMRHPIQSHAQHCCTFQVNKQCKHKYEKLPAKLIIANPWEALCVDLIGPRALRGKDGTEIVYVSYNDRPNFKLV